MRILPAILLCLALCAGPARAGIFPDNAFSDDARGLAGAQFLKTPPSARFAALAGAGLSLSGVDSFFLNPAGSFSAPPSLAVSYEALLEGSARTGLAFSRAAGPGVFSAGFIYNNSTPGLYALDGAGTVTGSDITAYDAAAGAGFARRFGWADAGLNIKFIRSKLADESASSFALDAGAVFREKGSSKTELAVAVRNFGPPMKLGSGSDPLPFELGGGIKWKYSRGFDVLIEGHMPCDHSPYLVFAGELYLRHSPSSGLFLRSGLNFKNYDDHGAMGAFAGGFGVKAGSFSFDYAFSPYGELGAAHRVTAGLTWGKPPEKHRRPVLPEKAALLVAPFTPGPGVTATEAAVVRNLLESELVKTGGFRVLERASLEFILEEKRLAYAGLAEEKAASGLGKVAGAELAVFGTVEKAGKEGYRITARFVDVASSVILRSETALAGEDYLFRDAARRLAAGLSE